MAIYRNNISIVANEAYTENDFARILYENEIENMCFFEEVMSLDMHEINALKEGTILEAEVEDANNKSKQSLLIRIIESARKWLAKIKGAINDFFKNMEQEILKATDLKKKIESAFNNIGGTENWSGNVDFVWYQYPNIYGSIYDDIIKLKKELSFSDISKELLVFNGDFSGKEYILAAESAQEFKKVCEEHLKKTNKIDKSSIDSFLKRFNDRASLMKDARENSKKNFDEINNALDNLSRQNDIEDITLAQKNLSALQNYYTVFFHTMISILRKDFAYAVQTSHSIIADVKRSGK